MSDIELLKQAFETLDNLDIPVKYLERLAIPIANVSNRLKILYNAVVEAMKKAENPEEPEAVPELIPESEEN